MKICIFAKYLPVHIKGGMEFHVQDLIAGLAEKGHEVTVITSAHPSGKKRESEKSIEIHYLDSEAKYFRERFFKESAKLFKKLHERKNFDIVHSQSNLGYGYIKYLKKYPKNSLPLIVTSHGTELNEIKTIMKGDSDFVHLFAIPFYLKFYLYNSKILYQKADKVIAVSKELKKDLHNQYEINRQNIKIIPNGVDTGQFKPGKTKIKEKLPIKTDEKVIMSCGSIRKQKGFHLLIDVLPDLLKEHNVKLLIVGGGPYLKNLKKKAKQLNLKKKVIFTGPLEHKKLPDYYNLADVFAFPTLREESFGIVLAEAMSCELPVVTTKIGGIPTVIDDNKEGFLINPGDRDSLKRKISKILGDPKLENRLAKKARKKVKEEFSTKKMVKETIKVYKEVTRRQ